MAEMLIEGDNIWVAREGEMIPHPEVKFVDDEYDRASLENRITAKITRFDAELPIEPLELQIAYKLYLSAQKDFDDAFHLYTMFGEPLALQNSNGGLRNSTSRTTMATQTRVTLSMQTTNATVSNASPASNAG